MQSSSSSLPKETHPGESLIGPGRLRRRRNDMIMMPDSCVRVCVDWRLVPTPNEGPDFHNPLYSFVVNFLSELTGNWQTLRLPWRNHRIRRTMFSQEQEPLVGPSVRSQSTLSKINFFLAN